MTYNTSNVNFSHFKQIINDVKMNSKNHQDSGALYFPSVVIFSTLYTQIFSIYVK